MFSLQRLLGKEDLFFKLLEDSAKEAHSSVHALVKLNKNPGDTKLFIDFSQARRTDKKIRSEITEAIYKTFVTALEREDIEDLSHALYRIPKAVEKFGERLQLAPQHVQGVDFSKQIDLLEQATNTISEMVSSLRQGSNLEKMMQLNDRLQFVEGEADKTILELVRNLYSSSTDPIKVIVLKDLYEQLEKIIDRCRDVGNIIVHIILKNS